MHIISMIINLFLISIFLLPAYAADLPQNQKNTEPGEIKKTSRIMFGMKLEEVTAILGDGCKPKVDTYFEPKGVAHYIKCKKQKLEFLHNNLHEITFQPGFDLTTPFAPFHEDKYNLPPEVKDKIRWGMGVQEFNKALDLWAKILDNYGIKIVPEFKNFKERLNHPLNNNECSMSKNFKKCCLVLFGPKSKVDPLERVQWIFSFDQQFPFDPKYRGLREIKVLDRDQRGVVVYKIK